MTRTPSPCAFTPLSVAGYKGLHYVLESALYQNFQKHQLLSSHECSKAAMKTVSMTTSIKYQKQTGIIILIPPSFVLIANSRYQCRHSISCLFVNQCHRYIGKLLWYFTFFRYPFWSRLSHHRTCSSRPF